MEIVLAMAVLLVVGIRVASAHDEKAMGVVKSVEAMHLEVQTTAGEVAMFMIDRDTKIRRGETPVTAADLETGERVVVVFTTHADGNEHGDHGAMSVAREILLGAQGTTDEKP